MLHGFLSYLMKCAITGDHYTIYGYKGKQVRDNIHSWDMANMFWHYFSNPKQGEAYNAGGGRHSNCSMQEAIALAENITGKKMKYSYTDTNRIGDHIWYISDLTKFKSHFPEWNWKYSLEDIMLQIFNEMHRRY
jgi:CDP-paratose 2-epimerase